ncbi:Matrix metalloproteinase-16, partial [Frankliniella fusca]
CSLKTDVPPGLNKHHVRKELQEALDLWARPSKLSFPEDNTNAEIEVYFRRGNHSDGYPFDGRGLILAHAFFPGSGLGGDVHFDADEPWLMQNHNNGSAEGISLFAVAAHEFGHSLGLLHSSVSGALMFPWYQGLHRGYKLPEDDTHAIQQIYGSRDERQWGEYRPDLAPAPPRQPGAGGPGPGPGPRQPARRPSPPAATVPPAIAPAVPPRPRDPAKPDRCNTDYDAVAVIRRQTFFFKGKYFWRFEEGSILEDYPVQIDVFWVGLPKNLTHIDAVYERNSDRNIVFFIGKKYYVFSGNFLESGYPKPLTDLGLPPTLTHIDGAMVWGHNGKTYLFSGTVYWRLDEDVAKVELDYPRDMSMWRGVGYNIDAVFQKDGVTYFFKGKGFWKFNDRRMIVEHCRPKNSAAHWMGCKEPEGTWFDWEENSVNIFRDTAGCYYDLEMDDDDEDSAASHITLNIVLLSISLPFSLLFTS